MSNWFEDAWEKEREEIEQQRKQEKLWCEREIGVESMERIDKEKHKDTGEGT